MPDLTFGQYNLVFNMLSFAVASMFAAFVFFVLGRQQVSAKYRGALVISALVVFIAGYHYFRILENWTAAYQIVGDMYVATGQPFNDAYRYIDWFLTVPLLLAELVAVLRLPKGKTAGLLTKLIVASILMIVTGFPGEVATSTGARALWGFISTIPFVYILYVLWVELSNSMGRQPEKVRVLVRNTRLIILATWGFYPIVYLLPMLGIGGASALVGVQVGYSIADVLAKAGYGLMIFWIAKVKSEADEQEAVVPATATVATAPAPAK